MHITDMELKQKIAKMLIVGFDTLKVNREDPIYRDIKEYSLGGVILFDSFYKDRDKAKNIKDPKQLKELTSQLQAIREQKLLIAIDQEGGKVARLKEERGFLKSISTKQVAKKGIKEAKKIYADLASELKNLGINLNFAPMVDLGINKDSKIIYKLERTYSDNPDLVSEYAEIFMEALKDNKVLSCLKHFPGHGSAKEDSHEGFVDISDTWSEIELEPYKRLIYKTKMIMTAHVYNKNLDNKYPATLSYNINTKLLREKLGYKGVIIGDDLQMGAIKKHYTNKEALKLCINSGVDIIMYCNQLGDDSAEDIIETVYELVKSGDISYERIEEANKRIDKILEEL